jgi:hypothetical protein
VILDDLDDPLVAWQYAERYLGVGTRTYSAFAADLEISPQYHPQLGRGSFPVPTFQVPDGAGSYLRNTLPSPLHGIYRGEGHFLLPVHPDTLRLPTLYRRSELLGLPAGPAVEVVPSANARTLFVVRVGDRPVPPHFVKLHYPRRLSRFTRRLRRPIISLQLWAARELSRLGVPLLPEVGGGVLGDDPRQAWGFLVRQARPAGGPRLPFTVPLFALYGRDYRAPGDPTLAEQLIVASGEDPGEYLGRRVVRPMVRLWLSAVFGCGCVPEPHGQNTLFTFTRDGRGSAVLYRDCALYVDASLRAGLGLGGDLPEVNVVPRDLPVPREQVLSLTYDSFMGHHALTYLAALADRRFGVPPKVLHEAARSAFAEWPQARAVLPGTVFYYDQVLRPDGRWRLVDTGESPVWR